MTSALIKFINAKREYIFNKNDVPNRVMGPIHALCLQLVAKGIIDLGICQKKRTTLARKN
jgi:hypothetical protein